MKTLLILCTAIALPVAGGCRKKEERGTREPVVDTTGKPVEAPTAPTTPPASATAPTTPPAGVTAPTAPASHATAPAEHRAGKPATHKRRVEAVHETWDIGEAIPKSQADAARHESARPEVRAPAATIPGAPAEHAATRFITIHPARRISGVTHLTMPGALAQELVTTEEREMDYRGRVCMDEKGIPAFVEPIQKTGVAAADREVERAVLGWRYEPYTVAGKPHPFCTGVRFRFMLTDSTDVE